MLPLLLLLAIPAFSLGEPPLRMSDAARVLAADPARREALLGTIRERLIAAGVVQTEQLVQLEAILLHQAQDPAAAQRLDHILTMTPEQMFRAAIAYSASKPAPEPLLPARLTLNFTGEPASSGSQPIEIAPGAGFFSGRYAFDSPGTAYGDSAALANALNLLADNDPSAPGSSVLYGGTEYRDLPSFLRAILSGSQLRVDDNRYYPNFVDVMMRDETGALRELMTPVFIRIGLGDVPVAHSHLHVSIRGAVNAQMTFYFGVQGSAAFRPVGTLGQSWGGERTSASFTGGEAAALLDRAGRLRRALAEVASAAELPLGGYGALGVCNDVNSMITRRGPYPFPMIREQSLLDAHPLLREFSLGLPNDRHAEPDPGRIWESRAFETIEELGRYFPETVPVYERARTVASGAPR